MPLSHDPELLRIAHSRLQEINNDDRDTEDESRPETVRAMPIVLHIPKQDVPERRALLEAAAIACLEVCLDDRAGSDTEFARALQAWYGARIRKIARRARNVHWQRVQTLPGVTAERSGAAARAFVPTPVYRTDPLLSKLQIGGTDVPPGEPHSMRTGAPVIAINSDLEMSVGKAAAQVGHGAMLLAASMTFAEVRAWAESGFDLQVIEVSDSECRCLEKHAGAVSVQDAGFTEVAPGSRTVVAVPAGVDLRP